MSYYIDLTVDDTKLPQFGKIKEISDLANAILADGVDFGYKKNAVQLTFDNKTCYFRINKINQSSYIENIEFFEYNLKKKRLVYVYSPYKELASDGMKFERTNGSSLFTSYTIKLIDDSTHLTKTLVISDNLIDDLAKVYDRKDSNFTQYGNQWLIHKFYITKTYFEKFVKDKRTYTSFNRFIYHEVLYKSRTVQSAFFFREFLRDALRYQILTTFNTIPFIPKYCGSLNI